jgi:hypothetical protein
MIIQADKRSNYQRVSQLSKQSANQTETICQQFGNLNVEGCHVKAVTYSDSQFILRLIS